MGRIRNALPFFAALTILFSSTVMAAKLTTPSLIGEEDPLTWDAKMYAYDMGIDLDTALYRLMIQDLVGDLDVELSVKEYETYAGLWIQHTPQFRIIAQFTQGGEETIHSYTEQEMFADLIEVRTASVPLVNLKVSQDTTLFKLRDIEILVESGINVFENRVELYVKDPSRLEAALQKSNIQLPSYVLVVQVDELSVDETQIFAGLELTTCTSGYSVIHSDGTEGITTAAHCQNSQSYDGTDLPFQGGVYGLSQDVQWHSAPGLTVRNLAYDGSGNRYIYSTKHRDNQAQNSWVCKYGRTSHYTCGFIIDKNYTPSDPPITFYGTWIRVHKDGVNISSGGDSGCPYFLGNTAYGIHSRGIGDDGIYMAINYISYLDLSVMTGTIFLPLVFSPEYSQSQATSGSENTAPYPSPDYEPKGLVPIPSTLPTPYP